MLALFGITRCGSPDRHEVTGGHPYPHVRIEWYRGTEIYWDNLTMDEVDSLIKQLKAAQRRHRKGRA